MEALNKEIPILKQIFGKDITTEENSIKITTKHGNVYFKLPFDYPNAVPNIDLHCQNKKLDNILEKLQELSDQLKGRFMLYSLIHSFYQIIEDRKTVKEEIVYLDDNNEIDDVTFKKWKMSRKKRHVEELSNENAQTGKMFFISMRHKNKPHDDLDN